MRYLETIFCLTYLVTFGQCCFMWGPRLGRRSYNNGVGSSIESKINDYEGAGQEVDDHKDAWDVPDSFGKKETGNSGKDWKNRHVFLFRRIIRYF